MMIHTAGFLGRVSSVGFLFFSIASFSTVQADSRACLDYKTMRRAVIDEQPSGWPTNKFAFRYRGRPGPWIRQQDMEIPEPAAWQPPNTGRHAGEWTTIHLTKVKEFDERNCSNFLSKTFSMGDASVGFTIGRIPESCSEIPIAIWYDQSGAQLGSISLMPMYNMNVETLWCVPGFTLFGLEAYYEGGGRADMLVMWHRSSNRWIFFQTPEKQLFDLMPDWLNAKATAVGETILLRQGDRALAIRPFEEKWKLK